MSDVTRCSGASTPCESGSIRIAWPPAHRSDRDHRRRSSPRTARPPRARSAASRLPAGQVFGIPDPDQGPADDRSRNSSEIIVRRRDDGSIVRLGDVARIELDSENYETSGWLSGKPAGTLPIYQYSDANALDIVEQVRETMDHLARSFPPGLEYRINYDTTKYVHENIDEVEQTLLRGVPAGADRRLRVPARGAGDDHPDAGDPGRRWWRPSR